jgi:hypothetical protein
MAGIDHVNRYPVVHTWSYRLADAPRYDSDCDGTFHRGCAILRTLLYSAAGLRTSGRRPGAGGTTSCSSETPSPKALARRL